MGVIWLVVGFIYRTKTKHQLLCSKSEFPNHFAFTLGRYLTNPSIGYPLGYLGHGE